MAKKQRAGTAAKVCLTLAETQEQGEGGGSTQPPGAGPSTSCAQSWTMAFAVPSKHLFAEYLRQPPRR